MIATGLRPDFVFMKRLLFVFLSVLAGFSARATDEFWINSGVVSTAPQIDATNVVNLGTMAFTNTAPFETSNTRNFTNRGMMISTVGWKLQHSPSGNGIAKAATVIHNHPGATISALDGVTSSKFILAATNIINEGLFSVDMSGIMSLHGTNVNLRRGGIQVAPLTGIGSAESVDFTLFLPDLGIIDRYWGIGTNTFNTANILSRIVTPAGTNWQAVSPTHLVNTPNFGQFVQVLASPATPFVRITNGEPLNLTITNSLGQPEEFELITNYIIQAAFIEVSGTNIGVQGRFYPSTQNSNLFNTIAIEIAATVTNSVTLQEDKMSLYVLDRLASETNAGLSTNIAVNPVTLKPSTYLVSRVQPFEYLFGDAPNGILIGTNLFFDPSFTNRFASANYAAYMFEADRLAAVQPSINGASITNIPGRIEIHAGSLNLERTRFRSDGLVTVNGKHLFSSTNANMDAFNLRFDLGSTNGTLRIQNLAKSQVNRFGGSVRMWSGLWNNTSTFIITNNYAPDTNTPPNLVPTPLTNTINWAFHALIMDAGLVALPTPVTTLDFIARATNVYLADPLNITNKFYTDALHFTVESPGGGIKLSNGVPNWAIGNSPNLRYLTNYGNILVENEARFGFDPAYVVPALSAFVNRSNVAAAGIFVSSDYFQNSGLMDSATILAISTVSGRLENSLTLLGGDLNVNANDFKLFASTNQSVGAMNFVITNSLFDSGSPLPNHLVCGDGFHFRFANGTGKPTVGDLLGTTLETAAPVFASVEHTWPGADFGVGTAGFSNNLALGRLVLSVGFDAEVVFSGSSTSNALYVDYLQFNGVDLAELAWALVIDPNLIIYFADSNLPAEELDGLVGGRLRWVKSYAGAYSSVDLLVNGQVIKVNRALRQSTILDSDGDGLANGFDPSPFDPAVLSLTVASASPLTLQVNWAAAANTVYKVEYTTNQMQGWQTLKYYTNTAVHAAPASVLDSVPSGSPQRYYRVGYQP
jgi:hypothetical protein